MFIDPIAIPGILVQELNKLTLTANSLCTSVG
jgi:hypothetical protein